MTNSPIPIFDGHNDTVQHLLRGRSFFEHGDSGHLDLPRAILGGFAGGFFAVYVPSDPQRQSAPPLPWEQDPEVVKIPGGYRRPLAAKIETDFAAAFTVRAVGCLLRTIEASAGRMRLVLNAAELENCLEQKVLAVLLAFEGADALDDELHSLYAFHQLGLRSLGITWSRPNGFGTGVPFAYPHSPDLGPGLTEAGCRLVEACNELKIVLDLSHLNEQGFWDVARLSRQPLVVTHTNAHALTPSARTLTDRQIDAVGDTGGVIGINFHVADVRRDGRLDPETPLSAVVEHALYVAERIGIEHVALGSDFDGATMPAALGDAAGLPLLIDALRAGGFDDAALRQVACGNWLRVLRAVLGA